MWKLENYFLWNYENFSLERGILFIRNNASLKLYNRVIFIDYIMYFVIVLAHFKYYFYWYFKPSYYFYKKDILDKVNYFSRAHINTKYYLEKQIWEYSNIFSNTYYEMKGILSHFFFLKRGFSFISQAQQHPNVFALAYFRWNSFATKMYRILKRLYSISNSFP